jgi:hypothetical protein
MAEPETPQGEAGSPAVATSAGRQAGETTTCLSSETKVFEAGGQQLTGDAATAALAGADTVSLNARLERPAQWRQDEDGQPVPTFRTSRADITD